MAALVQAYPQQTGTSTMLQTRSSSNSGIMSPGQAHANNQYNLGGQPQAPRSTYQSGYRGNAAPIQPYAFTNTSNFNQNLQWQQYGGYRTHSSPAVPSSQGYDHGMAYRGHPSAGSLGSNVGISHQYNAANAQQSFNQAPQLKNQPDRYRRSSAQTYHGRSQSSTLPSTLPMGHMNQVYSGPANLRSSAPNLTQVAYGPMLGGSMDDMQLHLRSPDFKRNRRRSMHSMDATDHSKPYVKAGEATRTDPIRPNSSAGHHARAGSSESVSSSRSAHSRPSSATNRNVPVPTGNPSSPGLEEMTMKQEQPKLVNIPPRGSSSDATKRTLNPSPLSRPATMASDTTDKPSSSHGPSAVLGSSSGNLDSPAAKQLAAINQKGGKAKSKTSRLRRAFSFGSAAEFRTAAGPSGEAEKTEPSKLHKEPTAEEAYDAEQARIAEAQEAAGIGNNIYGSRFFGSTDNLSISSTASSASIMIRKMGRGMKKSTRSFVGLFRPKSVIGVPAAEAALPEVSEAAVSMITVEAETQRVNVTPDPQTANGGTGFPHLERNSLDAAQMSDGVGGTGADKSISRKSIVGGERERAEVLAAVRKGILKRSGSPSNKPIDVSSPGLVLPSIPAIADSPISSAPSTPNEEAQGHRRTNSVAIGNEDYFMSALRLRQDTKSLPGTPQGSGKRNATFSPRIIFHDTWPSQEYDRRGEIATCNRLTPMLAQQIKEELNSFKMEMEVHENSKIYTHFF